MNQPLDVNCNQWVDDEKCLENFLLDIDCLDKLDKWTNRLNFFDILSVSGMEIRHSNFLAWLLDPKGNHGLGDYVLRKILLKAAKVYGPENTPIPIFDIDSIFLEDTIVERESSNIDIIAYSDVSKIVLVIENKIHSKEHSDQLETYYQKISERFNLECNCDLLSEHPDGYRAFFIYLTLDGDNPSHDDWYPLSHQYLQQLVKSMLETKELSDRCRTYLEDYYYALSGELMNDEELTKACMTIYSNHKQAIDLIIANLPNKQNVICQRCKTLLEDSGVELLTATRATLRFTTKKIREKAGRVGYDSWVSSMDILVFEIYVSPIDGYISLIIGPGDSKHREHWYKYLSNTSLYKVRNRRFTPSWTMIQTKRIAQEKNQSDESYINEFVQMISDYVAKLPSIEKIIEDAPPYDDD